MNAITKPAAVAPESLERISSGLRSGDIALRDYIDRTLLRIDEFEGSVRALIDEPGRRARLMEEAAALEAKYPDPRTRPALFGVLIGVKDIFAADGFETRAGSSLPPALFAMDESPVVTALRAAGAIILGKTVTTEFAYFAPGPTANPWDIERTPGGSSSGSAAAVAAGFCSLALGTQTIGSISRPAAFCGVCGWKPSYGRTSRDGVVPFSPSLDHVGLIAPGAADIAIAAPLVVPGWRSDGYMEALDHYSRRRPILAIPEGHYLAQMDNGALLEFQATVAHLRGAGFSIVGVQAFDDIEEINARHRRIAAAEMERTHREWFAEYGDLYAEATRELIRKGAAISDNDLERDKGERIRLRNEIEELLEEAGADYWICPAAQGPAPIGLDSTGNPVMNLPWTHAGLPTLALPGGSSKDGMPLGLQFAGPFGSDEALIALGIVVEAALRLNR